MHDSNHDSRCSVAATEREEEGYALLALLVAMAILVILLTAAAPVLKFEAQRERELEAHRRGEQVAQAIREYIMARGTLPNSMGSLNEGISQPGRTKKRYILRRSSMRDPLAANGEWQLVSPTERRMQRFAASVVEYGGGQAPSSKNLPPQLQQFHNLVVSLATARSGITGAAGGETGEDGDEDGAAEDAGDLGGGSASKPFIGVASQSTNDSIISYYGITKHNRIVFTPLFR